MDSYVSLLRGINVSGHRKIRMPELKALYESLKFDNVQTYLQSGNVVFKSEVKPQAKAIESAITRAFDYGVSVLVISGSSFQTIARSSPFLGKSGIDPKHLHLTFLFQALSDSLSNDALPTAENEKAVHLLGHYYLYCPNGYGRTKINNTYFERTLKMPTTTRNWNSVTALDRMLGEH